MTGVLPANAKRTNKGRFCRAKTFIRNKEGDRLTASWSAIEKQETEKKKRQNKKRCIFMLRNIVSRSCFFGNKIISTF